MPRPNRTAISAFYTAISLLLVAGSVSSNEAQNTVVVILRMLKQDAPVHAIGMRLSGTHNTDPLVHLRNDSPQKVLKIWVSVLIQGAQSGQTILVNSNGPNEISERKLDPNTDGWARDRVLTPSPLLNAGKNLKSNCLLVDVLIDRVEFEDGRTWSASWQQLLEESKLEEGSRVDPTCADANASVSELSQLSGIKFDPLPAPSDEIPENSKQQSEVQYHVFRCTLSARDGRMLAACPL